MFGCMHSEMFVHVHIGYCSFLAIITQVAVLIEFTIGEVALE